MEAVARKAVRKRWWHWRCDVRNVHVTPDSAVEINIPEVVYTPPSTVNEEEIEMTEIEDDVRRDDVSERSFWQNLTQSWRSWTWIICKKPSFKWTAMQSWSFYGFATCTLPWYLSHDKDKNEYVLKLLPPQKVFCILQHTLSALDAIMALRALPALFANGATPFTYIQISGVMFSITARLTFAKVVFYNSSCILANTNAMLAAELGADGNSEQTQRESETERQGTSTWIGRSSSLLGIRSLIASLLFTTFMIGIETGLLVRGYDDQWQTNKLPSSVQAFACYGRRLYAWKDSDTCGLDYVATSVAQLPSSELLWGGLGFSTFLNAKMAQYQKIVAINLCNVLFFEDARRTMVTIQRTQDPVLQAYNDLGSRTRLLSEFVGPLMILQLLELGTRIPTWSTLLLLDNGFLSLYIVCILVGIFPFIFLGSYGALIAEKIKDELAGERGRASRPQSVRETTALFLRLFKHAIGLGLFGIKVMDFGTLFTYFGFVGSYVMLLYEVEH